MDRLRWIAFALALLGVFCLSVAAGGLIARQGAAPSNPPVAVASPTPGPSTAPSQPPSAAPTPPAVTPSPKPASTPSAAPPSATAAPPSPTSAPTAALDPPTAQEFAAQLLAAFQTGDAAYLRERLHPEALARYGADQCRRHVNQLGPDPNSQWTVVSSSGPAPWSWETDGKATVIADATTVTVDEPGTGQRDLHFAPSDGTWRWFTDCGDPL